MAEGDSWAPLHVNKKGFRDKHSLGKAKEDSLPDEGQRDSETTTSLKRGKVLLGGTIDLPLSGLSECPLQQVNLSCAETESLGYST